MVSKRHAAMLAAAASILVGAVFIARIAFPSAAKKDAVLIQPLPVVAVVPRDIEQVIIVSGEFHPFEEADLDAKVRGYVQKLHNDVGDVVRRGAVLAELEVPELKDEMLGADAEVAVSEQKAEQARVRYADDKTVYDRLSGVARARPELIAQQDVDTAKAKSDASDAAFTAAQASIKQALANRTRITDMDAYSKIYAPFDGAITKRYFDEGALVGAASGPAGNAVFHISQLSKLRLVIMVPESSVPEIEVGKLTRVTVPALDQTFSLPVSRISHQLSEDTRTMHVEIDFDNRQDKVAPGMYAKVALPLKEHAQVLAVPLGAVRARVQDSGTVYVLTAGGQAEARQVKLGLAGANYVEVSSGLKAGELVVVDMTPQLDASVKYIPSRLGHT